MAFPLFLLMTPATALLLHNEYPLLTAEVGIFVAGVTILAAILGAVSWVGGRHVYSAVGAVLLMAVLNAAFQLFDFGYGMLYFLVPGFLALLVLREHGPKLLTVIFAVAWAALVVTRSFGPDSPPPVSAGHPTRNNLPLVVHIIFDGHIGFEGFPADLDMRSTRKAMIEGLVDEGFKVYGGAYSRYRSTRNSLSHLFNFVAASEEQLVRSRPATQFRRNAYVSVMKGLGFKIRVFQTGHFDLCSGAGLPEGSCESHVQMDMVGLRRTGAPAACKALWIARAYSFATIGLRSMKYLLPDLERWSRRKIDAGCGPPSWIWGGASIGSLVSPDILGVVDRALKTETPGTLLLAHVLLPHAPYVLDESCRALPVAAWKTEGGGAPPGSIARRAEYEAYTRQLWCVHVTIGSVVETLKRRGVLRNSTIIVHGDHGSRISEHVPRVATRDSLTSLDVADNFSTLFAVRRPGVDGGYDRELRPLEELLRESLPFLSDSSRERSDAVEPWVFLRGDGGMPGETMPLPDYRSAW